MTCPSCTNLLEPDAAYCSACGYRMRAKRGSLVGITLDDRYRIDARIAAGGFGAIYRATHIVTGREVALKILHADLASDSSLSARFRREGATLASLRDQHTVTTYELGEAADGTLYIAMELLRGDSLWDRFRVGGPLAWRKVLSIMKGVCSSLVEAHALGIVHRDLKPANIHLEPAPYADFVKVLDFGIAKLMSGSAMDDGSELTRIGTAVGTLDYMSPEQLVGGACDGRTDIYTLGVVMYEMITGQRPFADASGPTSLITALFTRVPTPPSIVAPPVPGSPNVPAALDAVILKCLEREPSDRFADIGELCAAIDRVLMSPVSPMAQIRTLAGHMPDRMFGAEEHTVRERPLAIAPDTDVEDMTELAAIGLGDEATVIEVPRMPVGTTPVPMHVGRPEYAAGSSTYTPPSTPSLYDGWQGSNQAQVWPPVLPPAGMHGLREEPPLSSFDLAIGSRVGPVPAQYILPPTPVPSATGTRIPQLSIARVILVSLLLLALGVAFGMTIAYAL